jgi:pyruvate dehydrogenase E2 component (dihydrolipoamide acetyltransferase)
VVEVAMPRLSDSMEEGTVLRWLKETGAPVAAGEEIVEIETDKATMTHEAESAGVFEAVAEEGDTVPLGATIARIHPEGTEVSQARTEPIPVKEPEGTLVQERPAPAAPAAPSAAPRNGARAANGRDRPFASPVARRLAAELRVDLSALEGSGPRGRIVKADVSAAAEREPAAEAPAPAAEAPAAERAAAPPAAPAPASQPEAGRRGETTIQELTRAQRVVARRMAEAKATAPEFVLTMDIDMAAAVALREQLRAMPGDAPLPTYNDMVVRAAALALRDVPRANGSYRDGRFELHGRVNIGVAVASEGGLTVPTIFDADTKPLGQIARESRGLAARVRERAITPPELSGGTFTVSNLGMYGVTSFVAILNPPQAGILAVGAVEERPVVRDGEQVVRPMMSATLTADHRILYGAEAAEFLGRIRDHLQEPRALLL